MRSRILTMMLFGLCFLCMAHRMPAKAAATSLLNSKPRGPHDAAIVQGDYKLIKDIDTGRVFLFNRKKDIGVSTPYGDELSSQQDDPLRA